MTYYTIQGDAVTADDIKAAVDAGTARIIYGRGDGFTTASLSLDSDDFDTRGECDSMWEEQWTAVPKSPAHALRVAYA